MVGIGGRSKACDNCRRRRVKCDQTRPECHKCLRLRLTCGGYPDLTVIQFDGRRAGKPSQPDPVSADEAALIPFNSTSSHESLSLFTAGDEFLLNSEVQLHPEHIFISFTRSRLLQGPDSTNITGVLPRIVDRNLVQKSFLALATTYFGMEHKEKSLVQRGMQQYGHTLEDVHNALSDPSRRTSFDLLQSITIMGFFEFLVSENEHGWINHCLGLERLINLRGPASFTNGPELIVLENARPAIACAALLLHRSTVFSKSEWKTMPWILYPERKNCMQSLIDILVDCPELFVMRDRIIAMSVSDDQASSYRELFRKTTDLLNQLDQWILTWNQLNPDCYHETVPSNTTPVFTSSEGRQTPAWTTTIEYDTSIHANNLTLYNATFILVLKFTYQTALSTDSGLTDQLQVSELYTKMLAAALMVCRSVDYHLRLMRSGASSFFLWFSLRMAYDALGRSNPVIGAWIRNVLQEVHNGNVGRWAIARYLLDIPPPGNEATSQAESQQNAGSPVLWLEGDKWADS
ncbi:hypothetical protein NA57DRAFT_49197 [Rhizodiscina lignyota]|uniref:Zn(2)-C6 fungal-type domain-containing protein n=1 Tax=Rhizodiscina lignyota TaxID=1504668 RepID=A0A9P4I736_9PEZI|nr:hypothetical protein NA57DRAFT_49197 [Rhizodiscina lignyota]